MHNHTDLANNHKGGVCGSVCNHWIYINFNDKVCILQFVCKEANGYKINSNIGEKGAKYFSRIITTTQSLYCLVNNIFTINNSHILSAISLKNDIHFTINDTYHEVNEFKKRGRKKWKSFKHNDNQLLIYKLGLSELVNETEL